METTPIVLHPMRELDLPDAYVLSKAVGWPHRLDDWRMAFALGEGLVAKSGAVTVGTVMWWRYGEQQARVGMVIVHPELQRAGLGLKLMQASLARIGATSVILNATGPGEGLYRRMGFHSIAMIEQHQGTAVLHAARAEAPNILRLQPSDLDRITSLDCESIGAPRKHVIEALLAIGEAVGIDEDGALAGVAFCRRFGRGLLIGPLIARDADTAEDLLAYWVTRHQGGFLRIDTPAALGLANVLVKYGLQKVDSVCTMLKGVPPEDGPARNFALANQALG